MSLTPQQEKFAQCIADGMNQADAYKAAYSNNMKPQTIYSNASRLLTNSKIKARIDELKAAIVEKVLWTRADSIRVMIDVINDEESRSSDKTAAVKVLNDMHGFNAPTEHKHTASVSVNLDAKTKAAKALGILALAKAQIAEHD